MRQIVGKVVLGSPPQSYDIVEPGLKLFACDFRGHYWSGMAVVLAPSEAQAREILHARMREDGLEPEGDEVLTERSMTLPGVKLFWNGDY